MTQEEFDEETKKYGVKLKKRGEVTMEKEYEKMKTVDIDNWENIRGPRPWEEDNPSNKIIEERDAKRREERLRREQQEKL